MVSHGILSSDPEVILLQAILNSMTYCGSKDLSLRHAKVFLGAALMIKVTKGRAYPNATQIGNMIGVEPDQFTQQLRELVEMRYLHEMHPTYGPLVMTYKPGSMGGIALQKMLPRELVRIIGEK